MFGSFVVFVAVLAAATTRTVPDQDGFQLHVIHLNDFHARFEETSVSSGVCRESCIGGFSRLYTAVHQQLAKHPDSIVLNAGDNFQGTLWYNIYKWNATQHFLNKIPTDAYTLGNHEFDDKIEGVVPFLKALNAPTLAANIDDSQEPDIQGLYKKSMILLRNGKRIGIIGVLASITDQISNSEKLKFTDESEAVNKEAERLVAEENVDTIIVLSHCGYEVEKEIARKASPKIGLIVGAHSHSFLYTGDTTPNNKTPEGPYPTTITKPNGELALVVQAAAYTEFLGDITINYAGSGEVVSWSGTPIYLDSNIPQDDDLNKEIAVWKQALDDIGNDVLGQTKVVLDQSACRHNECNFGNFVADSMVYTYLDTDEEDAWTSASIAVTNAGGIRTSLEIGDITFNDLVTALPFENTLDIGDIKGKYIKEFLEQTTHPFNNERVRADVNLLQISGMRIVYNMTNPVGSQVQSVRIRCRKCSIPKYEDLDLNETYKIVVNSFLANGGDGLTVISENLQNRRVGPVDTDVLKRYIKRESPITTPVEERINIVQ